MSFFLYASFPNSRNRNRSPTRVAQTYQVEIGNEGDVPATKLADADENRTNLTIENTSISDDMYYGYAAEGIVDPTAFAVFGLIFDLYVDTITGLLYVKTFDNGTNTNWVLTTLQESGFLIRAAQSVDIAALTAVYAQAVGTPATAIVLDLDYGRG